MHHINWWAVALVGTTLAKNFVTYMPLPGSATSASFINNPWYVPCYHFCQGILALNFTSSAKMLAAPKPDPPKD